MSRLVAGGLLVISLLGLYLWAVIYAMLYAGTCQATGTPPQCTPPITDFFVYFLQTVGALVSAVVVSELAVTSPGDTPGMRIAAAGSGVPAGTVKTLASLYVLAWFVSGLALVVWVWGLHDTVPAATAAAKEWLGYAIAAGYAYFGVSAPKN